MKRIITVFFVFAGIAYGSANCSLKSADARPYDAAINEIFSPPAAGGGTVPMDFVDLEQSYPCFANYVLLRLATRDRAEVFGKVFGNLQSTLKATSSQKSQAGSSSTTGGSTNLVSKGTTAEILSVATEYGALSESTNNQTVTVQGTLDGPFQAATRQYLLGYCKSGVVDIARPSASGPSRPTRPQPSTLSRPPQSQAPRRFATLRPASKSNTRSAR